MYWEKASFKVNSMLLAVFLALLATQAPACVEAVSEFRTLWGPTPPLSLPPASFSANCQDQDPYSGRSWTLTCSVQYYDAFDAIVVRSGGSFVSVNASSGEEICSGTFASPPGSDPNTIDRIVYFRAAADGGQINLTNMATCENKTFDNATGVQGYDGNCFSTNGSPSAKCMAASQYFAIYPAANVNHNNVGFTFAVIATDSISSTSQQEPWFVQFRYLQKVMNPYNQAVFVFGKYMLVFGSILLPGNAGGKVGLGAWDLEQLVSTYPQPSQVPTLYEVPPVFAIGFGSYGVDTTSSLATMISVQSIVQDELSGILVMSFVFSPTNVYNPDYAIIHMYEVSTGYMTKFPLPNNGQNGGFYTYPAVQTSNNLVAVYVEFPSYSQIYVYNISSNKVVFSKEVSFGFDHQGSPALFQAPQDFQWTGPYANTGRDDFSTQHCIAIVNQGANLIEFYEIGLDEFGIGGRQFPSSTHKFFSDSQPPLNGGTGSTILPRASLAPNMLLTLTQVLGTNNTLFLTALNRAGEEAARQQIENTTTQTITNAGSMISYQRINNSKFGSPVYNGFFVLDASFQLSALTLQGGYFTATRPLTATRSLTRSDSVSVSCWDVATPSDCSELPSCKWDPVLMGCYFTQYFPQNVSSTIEHCWELNIMQDLEVVEHCETFSTCQKCPMWTNLSRPTKSQNHSHLDYFCYGRVGDTCPTDCSDLSAKGSAACVSLGACVWRGFCSTGVCFSFLVPGHNALPLLLFFGGIMKDAVVLLLSSVFGYRVVALWKSKSIRKMKRVPIVFTEQRCPASNSELIMSHFPTPESSFEDYLKCLVETRYGVSNPSDFVIDAVGYTLVQCSVFLEVERKQDGGGGCKKAEDDNEGCANSHHTINAEQQESAFPREREGNSVSSSENSHLQRSRTKRIFEELQHKQQQQQQAVAEEGKQSAPRFQKPPEGHEGEDERKKREERHFLLLSDAVDSIRAEILHPYRNEQHGIHKVAYTPAGTISRRLQGAVDQFPSFPVACLYFSGAAIYIIVALHELFWHVAPSHPSLRGFDLFQLLGFSVLNSSVVATVSLLTVKYVRVGVFYFKYKRLLAQKGGKVCAGDLESSSWSLLSFPTSTSAISKATAINMTRRISAMRFRFDRKTHLLFGLYVATIFPFILVGSVAGVVLYWYVMLGVLCVGGVSAMVLFCVERVVSVGQHTAKKEFAHHFGNVKRQLLCCCKRTASDNADNVPRSDEDGLLSPSNNGSSSSIRGAESQLGYGSFSSASPAAPSRPSPEVELQDVSYHTLSSSPRTSAAASPAHAATDACVLGWGNQNDVHVVSENDDDDGMMASGSTAGNLQGQLTEKLRRDQQKRRRIRWMVSLLRFVRQQSIPTIVLATMIQLGFNYSVLYLHRENFGLTQSGIPETDFKARTVACLWEILTEDWQNVASFSHKLQILSNLFPWM